MRKHVLVACTRRKRTIEAHLKIHSTVDLDMRAYIDGYSNEISIDGCHDEVPTDGRQDSMDTYPCVCQSLYVGDMEILLDEAHNP